jgi:hypothetical protein
LANVHGESEDNQRKITVAEEKSKTCEWIGTGFAEIARVELRIAEFQFEFNLELKRR